MIEQRNVSEINEFDDEERDTPLAFASNGRRTLLLVDT